MADDLIFPPDDVSNLIGGFDTNLDDLLDIPTLVPSMDTMVQNMHSLPNTSNQNNISSLPATSYRPIDQLMIQTQALSSNLNQQMGYDSMNSSSMISQQHRMQNSNNQNQLLGNNVNFINPNVQKNSQFLVVGGQRIQTQPLQQAVQHPLQPSSSPLQGEGSPVFDIGSPSSSIKQNSLSMNNNKTLQISSNSPVQLPVQQIITTNSQQKKAIVLKTPQQQIQHIQTHSSSLQSASPNQIQQNGVVIKTANQQLMFVTEVNGKKVGYLLPNQKGSVSLPSSPNISNFPVTVASSRSPLQGSLHQRQQIISQNPKAPTLDSIKPTIAKDSENKSTEMGKLIKERLQGLRNNGISLNLKSQLLNREKSGKISPPNRLTASQIDPDPPVARPNQSVSRIISDFDNTLNDTKDIISSSSLNSYIVNNQSENRDILDEEEGQEIEFSENDLTAEVNEQDSDEPIITSISVRQCNEIEDITAKSNEDEDEDSVPLALLKHDTSFEEPISIVCEKSEEGVKPSKRLKNIQDDSVPLSVVAASLKRDQEAPKKKKRGRKKKDKDEPPRPILAYQVFFRQEQVKLKGENPIYKENFGELSKKIGQLWEKLDLDKKKVYQENYAKAKAEYDIVLKEYKIKKAQEAIENNIHEEEDDDDAPLKKTVPPKKGKKATTTRHKLTATTIATSSTLSPPLVNHFNEESNDSIMEEATDVVVPGNAQAVPEVKRKRKYTKRSLTAPKSGVQLPPSPSPPSTDTEEDSSDDNEGEDTKLSRICELAAKASSRLKKIEKQNAKVKSKEGGAKRGRVVKMEVETVSTNISIDPHPVAPLIQPKLELANEPKSPVVEELEQPETIEQEPAAIPIVSSKVVSAKEIKVKEKDPIKATEPSTNIKSVDKKSDSIPPTSPPSKGSFKIPKKTNGENGQVVPQGPRLCIRDSCSNHIKVTRERGAQYCSNDCLVLYCREVFDVWVIDRQKEDSLT